MSYIPSPSVTTKIGNKEHFRHPRSFQPRIKKVEVEPICVVKKVSLDNKFRATFLNSLFDTRQPNYSSEEIRNVLENVNEKDR